MQALRLMQHVRHARLSAAHLLQGGHLERGTRQAAGTGSSLERPGNLRQPSALPGVRPPSAATACRAMIALHGTLPSAALPRLAHGLAAIPSWDFLAPSGSPLRSPGRACCTLLTRTADSAEDCWHDRQWSLWSCYSHASRPKMAAAVSNACSNISERSLNPVLCQHMARMVHRPSATAQP